MMGEKKKGRARTSTTISGYGKRALGDERVEMRYMGMESCEALDYRIYGHRRLRQQVQRYLLLLLLLLRSSVICLTSHSQHSGGVIIVAIL